jgi:hypothetical protein
MEATSDVVAPDALIGEYCALCADAARHSAEGWSPSPVEAWKDSALVTPRALANFRCSTLSGGTQNWPDRPQDRAGDADGLYAPRSAGEAEAAAHALALGVRESGARLPSELHEVFLRLALDDDRCGGRPVEVPGLGPVTESSIRFAYYGVLLSELVHDGDTVLEIGAGFGGTCSRLLQRRRDIRYIITDLPLNLLLAAHFLGSRLGARVRRVWTEDALAAADGQVLLVAPWLVERLGGPVHLAVNTMSFQHMTRRNLEYYGTLLATLGTKMLYMVNRVGRRDPTDVPLAEYPFLPQYRPAMDRPFGERWRELLLLAARG